MLKLFHSPGACSDGILVLLEEIGAAYEVEIIDLAKGIQRDPTFLQKNPKGKVPSIIRSDGSCLTEFQTISYWLAREFEQTGIWPDDLEEQCRTLEVRTPVEYCTT
jgi:glutathione S-transferase